MIETHLLAEIVKSALLSARVKIEQAKVTNLFIVAPFERGKTSLVLENSGPQKEGDLNVIVLTDVTGMGILEALTLNQKATHVIINDLSAVQGHKEHVSHLTMAILNALAEEGTYKIAVPRMQHLDLKGRTVGVIACCVPDSVSDKRSWWYRSGFLSRMLILRYDHSTRLQLKIMRNIRDDKLEQKTNLLYIPEFPVKVSIPKKESSEIMEVATAIVKETNTGEVGYRKQKQLRGLVGGHALLRGCNWKKGTTVNRTDVDFLEKALPFFTGDGKTI